MAKLVQDVMVTVTEEEEHLWTHNMSNIEVDGLQQQKTYTTKKVKKYPRKWSLSLQFKLILVILFQIQCGKNCVTVPIHLF